MGLLRFSYTYVLNRSSFVEKLINWVRFLSNAIIIQDSGGFKDSDLEFLNLKSKLIIKGVLRTVRVSASPMVHAEVLQSMENMQFREAKIQVLKVFYKTLPF